MIRRTYFKKITRWEKQKPKTRSKVKSITKLMKECDAIFSRKVRRVDIGEEFIQCFTCEKAFSKKKVHCGHYLSRYYKAARWNEDNCRPQCMMCNMWRKGEPIVFRQKLINEIGEARVLAVEALRDAPIKLSREFLEEKLVELKADQI